ncbi:MAG: AGE family epimerase/isomerase [Hyphomonas sp.]|uniref:AGE family epimerase/isomerase n=1 Tax=Hyphomonas sp. TaxID=87 RepID=UPI00352811FF
MGRTAETVPGEAVSRARRWAFDVALPFWHERGLDRVLGGPVEALTPAGENAHSPFKRTRVVARQLYAFSHAAELGWAPGAGAADHVWAFFRDRVWQGPDAGWPRCVDPAGDRVLDAVPDLYDYAFALFALGWRYRLSGEAEALKMAHQTLDLVEARFRHPLGGFLHEVPAPLPRQQNPHMHLTEAAIVLAEASGEDRFHALASELVDLFRTRIVRMPSGILPEFFGDDWSVAPGDAGQTVEPGHQFEWAWILARHQAMTSTDNSDLIEALVVFAEQHGFDPVSHRVYASVGPDGTPRDKGTRTWPSTERIKGWIALNEVTGRPAGEQVAQSIGYLMRTHLAASAVPGTWTEYFDAAGQPVTGSVPASTLYHLLLAFAEAMRWSAQPDTGAPA